jgi:hypothetical protein
MSGLLHRLRNSRLSLKLACLVKAGCLVPRIPLGLGVFLAALLGSCLLAAISLEMRGQMFMAGDVATRDVTADQNLRVEDREATLHKRDQMADNQPPVYDLLPEPFDALRNTIQDILTRVRKPEGDDLEKLRWQLSEDLNTEIGRDTLSTMRTQDFQDMMSNQVLPWLKAVYAKGVLASAGQMSMNKNGFLLREMPSGMETLIVDTQAMPDLEQIKDHLDYLLKVDLKKNFRVRKAATLLVGAFLEPNLTANPDLTQTRKNEVMGAVEPVYYNINRGEIIVRMGERVSLEQQTKLQAIYTHRSPAARLWAVPGMFLLSGLFLVLLHLSQGRKMGIRSVPDRDWLMMSMLVVMFAFMGKFVELMRFYSDAQVPMFIKSANMAYGLPIAGAAGVMAMFLPQALVSFFVLLLSFMVTNELNGGLYLFSYYFLSGLVYSYIIKDSENRQAVMRSIFPLAGLLIVMWLGASFVDYQGWDVTLSGAAYAVINAIFSLLLVLGLSPILEMVFGYTSRFKLMELMSLEQPLLQELMVKAPGTYHHSVIVANMVEAGARAIRANALLARVAALYHDIGKLKNPQYFIENLFGKENRHNKLSPSMSALILISHVKKGVELARESRLGEEIANLIGQHHGMTLIAFFYHKAQELAEAKGEEPVREDEFRYPGPKPQTKEAGLILLADAIEASSRTLVDPTPSRIKGHIQSIVRKIYTEGELDESELTLKDLTLISETFHRILTGIFHHRIEYPSMDRVDKPKKCGANAANGTNCANGAEKAA